MNALKAAEPDLHPSSRTKTREVKADANVGFAASISSGPPAAVGRAATADPSDSPPQS
jgi:hypothetical protein